VVPPNAHPDALADLWKVANLESNQGASVFRVSVESITAALNAYLTPTQIRSLLQKGSRVPLPPTVERLIDDQGQRYGRIKVGVAHTYVKTDDPALLEELRRDKKLSKLDWRDVAPCVAFVASADPSSVIESLRRSGYLPIADEEPPAPRNGSPTLRAVPTRQPTPVDTGSMSKADRRALLRLVNTAIESDISLVTTWVEKGRPRTTELEMIDLHDDELHAFDLEDDSREVLVPIRSILELQAGGMLVDDPYGDEGP
jgi:hypothetical protein